MSQTLGSICFSLFHPWSLHLDLKAAGRSSYLLYFPPFVCLVPSSLSLSADRGVEATAEPLQLQSKLLQSHFNREQHFPVAPFHFMMHITHKAKQLMRYTHIYSSRGIKLLSEWVFSAAQTD